MTGYSQNTDEVNVSSAGNGIGEGEAGREDNVVGGEMILHLDFHFFHVHPIIWISYSFQFFVALLSHINKRI